MYHKTVLHGIRVMIVDMPYMESVALGIWIGAGGRYENKRNSGISHFLEHMVFKGSKTRTTRDIKESIEGIGGSLNGFTDEEMTCYFVKLPKKFITLGLDVLSDMVINPKLSKSDIAKEKSVVYEEIKMYKDRPDHYVHQLLSELLWPSHPLGMPLVGTEKTISEIDRTCLVKFKERFHVPENIVICVCGQVDKGQFLEGVHRHFCKLQETPVPHFKKFLLRKSRKTHFKFYSRDTEQVHLAIGFHNVSRFHPDKYTSKLLHIILGGNMSSRLFHEVREERGLAYDISTSIKHLTDTGAFLISAGVDKGKLAKSVEVIMRELRKIKKIRIKDDELQRAKDFYKGQLFMGLEDTLNRMLWMGEKLIVKDINYNVDEIVDSIDLINPDMVRELARRIFREDNMSVAIIGPFAKEKKSIKSRFRL